MKTKTKTKRPPGMPERHNERVSPTSTAKSIANAMRDYADRWRANGTRVPADVLEVWAEFVEGQELRTMAAKPSKAACKPEAAPLYCRPGCGHTNAEHDAFDEGVDDGRNGRWTTNLSRFNTFEEREAYLYGKSTGECDARPVAGKRGAK